LARQIPQPQQFPRAAARPSLSSANPACRQLFELLSRRIGFWLKRRFVDPPIRHVRNEHDRVSDRKNSDANRRHHDSQNTRLEDPRRDRRYVPTRPDIRLLGSSACPERKIGGRSG